jgi:hypothetical protein
MSPCIIHEVPCLRLQVAEKDVGRWEQRETLSVMHDLPELKAGSESSRVVPGVSVPHIILQLSLDKDM